MTTPRSQSEGRHKIKGTSGITASYLLPDGMVTGVCDLDVELELPAGVEVGEGWTVLPLKFYMIWVHSVVRQEGFYLQERS